MLREKESSQTRFAIIAFTHTLAHTQNRSSPYQRNKEAIVLLSFLSKSACFETHQALAMVTALLQRGPGAKLRATGSSLPWAVRILLPSLNLPQGTGGQNRALFANEEKIEKHSICKSFSRDISSTPRQWSPTKALGFFLPCLCNQSRSTEDSISALHDEFLFKEKKNIPGALACTVLLVGVFWLLNASCLWDH